MASTSFPAFGKRGNSSPAGSGSPIANKDDRDNFLVKCAFNANSSDGTTEMVASSIQYLFGCSAPGRVAKFNECRAPSGTITTWDPGRTSSRIGPSSNFDNFKPAGFCDSKGSPSSSMIVL